MDIVSQFIEVANRPACESCGIRVYRYHCAKCRYRLCGFCSHPGTPARSGNVVCYPGCLY